MSYLDGHQSGMWVFDLEGSDPPKLAIGYALDETATPYNVIGDMKVVHTSSKVTASFDKVVVTVSLAFRFAVNEGFGKELDNIIDKIAAKVAPPKLQYIDN